MGHGGWLELSSGKWEGVVVVDVDGGNGLVATRGQGLSGAVRLVQLLAIVICQVVRIILDRGAEVLVAPVALNASPGSMRLIGTHVGLAPQASVRPEATSFG